VTLTGSVSSGSGTPSGVVVFENSATGQPFDKATLSGGTYNLSTTMIPGGSYKIKAHYGGDGNFGPSDSALVQVNSTPQTSQVRVSFVTFNGVNPVLSTAAQSVPYGSPYIVRVDVTNNGGTPCQNLTTGAISFVCPTGPITLLDNGAALNDFPNAQTPNATNVANLNNRGFIEDQPIQLNAGTHNMTASYSGDASYSVQAASNTLAITITKAATATTVVPSTTIITSGGSVTLTATVGSNSNADKAHAPSGTVQFFNGGSSLGAPITCTQVGFTTTAGASCTAKLTTALTALPPGLFDTRPRRTPFEFVAAMALLCALAFFLMALRLRGQKRGYGYAGVVMFLIAAAAFAGCGGGGGGTTGHSVTITAKYSGDTNYAASSATGTSITVQ
jgi:hypothetical protein